MSTDQKEWPKAVLAEDMPADFMPQPLPQPPEHLFGLLGNLPDINPNFMMESLWKMADIYGPIYYMNAVNRRFIVVSDYEYAHQVQDDDFTEKFIVGVQNTVRELTGNGLLTAHQDDKEWHKAHRMLVPVFGPIGIRRMFPQMQDIASQLILKWDREGPDRDIDCSAEFIKLAFDTVGICAFNHRFNQFYKEAAHPFAGQMSDFLTESGRIANRTAIENALRRRSVKTMYDNIAAMTATIEEIVDERVKNPRPEVNDLLNVLLNSTDTVTGEKLSEENVRFQMLTFLIAGHETTSATLSFMLYRFLKNPETLLKAQREVDEVVGDNTVELKHIPQLKYIYASMQEALRLTPPIGATTRRPKKDLVLSGKYKIDSNTGILINFHHLHQDTRIFGEDIQAFRPERFFERKIPTDAWRPFGVGMRGCVGRFFAEQEILLNIALILQRFQIEMADPSYELLLKVAGTIKPLDFKIRARRRPGKSLYVGLAQQGSATSSQSAHKEGTNGTSGSKRGKMIIAYGSNAGTCKSLAEDMQSNAPEHGFDAELITLDQATEGLPNDVPVVIYTSSYEGKPTDNAKKFVSWLEMNADKPGALKGRHFAVFGVGNTEWSSTYQKVPKTIEKLLKDQGAQQITDAFFSDIKYDTPGDYEKWADGVFAALKSSGQAGELEHKAEIKASVIKHDAPGFVGNEKEGLSWGVVKNVRSFGGLEVGPEKREVEIELPAGVSYSAGDYLSVQPANHPENVKRALSHFGLHSDDLISISGTRKSYLKTDGSTPISAGTLLSQRVELGQAATQRQIETLIAHDSNDNDRKALESLADASRFQKDVIAQNYSVLDILEDHPSVKLPLATYLDMLRPMAARQYSIASSVLAQDYEATKTMPPITVSSTDNDNDDEPEERRYTATITYDVHSAPARSGNGRFFHGVASSYLARLRAGDKVHCTVRRTNNTHFRLPDDPSVPVIFIAAGTGIAPMRGFIQERAALIAARNSGSTTPINGKSAAETAGFAPAILYFGCRDFEKDNLYADELKAWEASGAVEVRYAFSRRGPEESEGYKYVHERIYADRDEVANLFSQKGAKIFLCGSAGKLARSCADTLKKIYVERNAGASDEQAEAWLASVKETRYVTDVFD